MNALRAPTGTSLAAVIARWGNGFSHHSTLSSGLGLANGSGRGGCHTQRYAIAAASSTVASHQAVKIGCRRPAVADLAPPPGSDPGADLKDGTAMALLPARLLGASSVIALNHGSRTARVN